MSVSIPSFPISPNDLGTPLLLHIAAFGRHPLIFQRKSPVGKGHAHNAGSGGRRFPLCPAAVHSHRTDKRESPAFSTVPAVQYETDGPDKRPGNSGLHPRFFLFPFLLNVHSLEYPEPVGCKRTTVSHFRRYYTKFLQPYATVLWISYFFLTRNLGIQNRRKI